MFSSGNCASVPLVASLDGCGGNGNNSGNGMWGGENGLLFIIVLALLFGWGNNNRDNNSGSNGGGYANGVLPYVINTSAGTDSEVQRGFNQQATISKLDGITQGICDATYALNSSLQSGFAGVNQALCNGFNNTNTAMLQGFNAANVTALQGFNGVERGFCNLGNQLSSCCCDIERGIDGVNYNNAMQTSALQNTMCNNTRDIIDNQNANARMLYDFMVQSKLDAKDEKIASQAQQITALQFAASQADQNAFIAANQTAQTAELIRRLGADCPVNAYVVQPPTPVTFPTNCCGQFNGYSGYNNGYNNGCGCNSGCGCA